MRSLVEFVSHLVRIFLDRPGSIALVRKRKVYLPIIYITYTALTRYETRVSCVIDKRVTFLTIIIGVHVNNNRSSHVLETIKQTIDL